ncbi:hypothetical protein V6N13_081762 [Hibiscus sabdariffa]
MQEGREAIKASMKRNIGNPFELKRLSPVPQQAIEDEVKATSPLKKFASFPHHSEQVTKADSVTSAIVKANESKEFSNGKNKSALITSPSNQDEVKETSPLKNFASLPHRSEQLAKAAFVTSSTVKSNESKEFSNGKNKSALMQEGREAITASMKRNIGNPFELKRLSPGGPDPHHHR